MQKNNITAIFLLAALFLALGLVYYLFVARSQNNKSSSNNLQVEDADTYVNEQKSVVGLDINVPEGAQFYEASSSEIVYKVKKMFFDKPTQEVVGKAQNVLAAGWLNDSTKEGYVKLLMRFSDFKTDNEKRDADTLNILFKDNEQILVEGFFTAVEVLPSQSLKASETFRITLNNVTKEVPVSFEVLIEDNAFKASGSAVIKLSDFNLKAPSLANVFEVSDDVIIEFVIRAVRSSQEKSNS